MAVQIHALKNKMTAALIIAGAMLDGVVPADREHLRKLMQALVEANTLLSRVPKNELAAEPAEPLPGAR